jgi:hypothetical protein
VAAKSALQLILKHGSLEAVLEAVGRKHPPPEDYPYKEARALFQSARRSSLMQPNPRNFTFNAYVFFSCPGSIWGDFPYCTPTQTWSPPCLRSCLTFKNVACLYDLMDAFNYWRNFW